jgi:hypothetical protein
MVLIPKKYDFGINLDPSEILKGVVRSGANQIQKELSDRTLL